MAFDRFVSVSFRSFVYSVRSFRLAGAEKHPTDPGFLKIQGATNVKLSPLCNGTPSLQFEATPCVTNVRLPSLYRFLRCHELTTCGCCGTTAFGNRVRQARQYYTWD